MNWRDHIHSDPAILSGRPVVRGTRISVEFLLKLVGGGWSESRIIEQYPFLLPDQIRAAALFAQDVLADESYVASAWAGGG